jgi:hypothetical protein
MKTQKHLTTAKKCILLLYCYMGVAFNKIFKGARRLARKWRSGVYISARNKLVCRPSLEWPHTSLSYTEIRYSEHCQVLNTGLLKVGFLDESVIQVCGIFYLINSLLGLCANQIIFWAHPINYLITAKKIILLWQNDNFELTPILLLSSLMLHRN